MCLFCVQFLFAKIICFSFVITEKNNFSLLQKCDRSQKLLEGYSKKSGVEWNVIYLLFFEKAEYF